MGPLYSDLLIMWKARCGEAWNAMMMVDLQCLSDWVGFSHAATSSSLGTARREGVGVLPHSETLYLITLGGGRGREGGAEGGRKEEEGGRQGGREQGRIDR